jgi:hypothetical protein
MNDEVRFGEWMPIDTVPRDGRTILLFDGSDYHVGWAEEGAEDDRLAWCTGCVGQEIDATHWMPLPLPPGDGPESRRARNE